MEASDRVYARRYPDGRTFYIYYDPGLGMAQAVLAGKWRFNDDLVRPSFDPSIVTSWTERDGTQVRSHCFISRGKIIYLEDCTHALAGKTVELLPVYRWPEKFRPVGM